MARADLSATYKLRELKSSADADFAEAITLYARHMAPDLKTNTNEITYWVDNYNKTHDDHFHLFAFYVNNRLAGFCELVFLVKHGLVVIDYMVIDEKFRGGLNVFFEFAQQVQQFIRDRYPDYLHAVVEIAPSEDETGSERSGVSLLRLLKMSGFGVVDAPYIQPQLGLRKPQTELPGALMMFPKPLKGELSREAYLTIVEAIYIEHYLRWYSMHGDDYRRRYEADIRKLLAQISSKAVAGSFHVNGLKHMPAPVQTAVIRKTQHLSMQISVGLGIVLAALATILGLMKIAGLGALPMLELLFATLIAFFAVASLFTPKAKHILKELLQALRSLLAKDQNIAGTTSQTGNKVKRAISKSKASSEIGPPE